MKVLFFCLLLSFVVIYDRISREKWSVFIKNYFRWSSYKIIS